MKRLKLTISFCLLTISIVIAQSQKEFHRSRLIAKIVNTEYIIDVGTEYQFTYHPELSRLNQKYNFEKIMILNRSHGKDIITLNFEKDINIQAAIRDYGKIDLFQYVEPDYIGKSGGKATLSFIPNDEFYSRQWSHNNDGSFNLYNSEPGADVEMESAWEITKGSSDITIAILDSGVRFNHDEFEGRFWENEDETTGNTDNDGNGYAGDHRGWDFVNSDNDPTDDHGHGTNVSGIIGAQGNNNIGYAGVDWNAKLMILKILDDTNSGYYSWWIEAMYYAIDNGANVMNMSVGGSGFSEGMKDAAEEAHEAGVAIITCMMNENNNVPYYPAAYESTIAIGSTNPDDSRSDSFPWNVAKGSNYGSHIDLSAPGNYIFGLSYSSNSNFGTYWSGTSQATPLVTGTVSLLLSVNPDLKPEEIRSILRSTSEDLVGRSNEDTPGWDDFHGEGRLNAFNALNTLNTSVKTFTFENHFKILENPIFLPDAVQLLFDNQSERSISIYSSSGNKIIGKTISFSTIKIDTKLLESGVYFIHVQQPGKNYTVKKIIVL